MNKIKVGDRVQNVIGQWFEVIEVQANGYRFRVHAIGFGAGVWRRFGQPFLMGRSELRVNS